MRSMFERDVLDSRDIIHRIDELTNILSATAEEADGEYDELASEHKENHDDDSECDCEAVRYTREEFVNLKMIDVSDETSELKALNDLAEEGSYTSDWHHGTSLIADEYFEEYAKQFAEDVGYVKRDVNWPYTHINWEAAADELKQDYFSVEYEGTTYWIRS